MVNSVASADSFIVAWWQLLLERAWLVMVGLLLWYCFNASFVCLLFGWWF